MVSDLEESAEASIELINEEMSEGKDAKEKKFIGLVALSAMVMALLSALGALLVGITTNEALQERMEESIEVSYIEGDRLNIEILKSKHDVLISLGKTIDQSELVRIKDYEKNEKDLAAEVRNDDAKVKRTILLHEFFAVGVTLLSIAITLCGLALLAKRRSLFIVGLVFSCAGASIVFYSVFMMLD